MKTILSLLGFGWTKWHTVEENKPMIRESFNLIWGVVLRGRVYVDIQRRENSLTGKVKFKNIIR